MPRRTTLPDARLELAPLIDVVFVLLSFFILALVVTTRLELTDILLPEARAGEDAPTPTGTSVVVALSIDGELSVDGEATDVETLRNAVEQAFERSPEASLVFAPDRGAPTGMFLDVLDALGEAGYSDVPVLRMPASTSGPTP